MGPPPVTMRPSDHDQPSVLLCSAWARRQVRASASCSSTANLPGALENGTFAGHLPRHWYQWLAYHEEGGVAACRTSRLELDPLMIE